MSDYIKYMYREYLEGRTRIKKVNEDQPLFPNTGAGLLIQKNKLTDDWTALNVSDGHYWYSLVPIFSDRKLYEHVRGNKENKTLLMAYLIISLLTIAQLAAIIIFLNNLVQIFV